MQKELHSSLDSWIKRRQIHLTAALALDHEEGPTIYYVNLHQLMKGLNIMYICLQTSMTIGNLIM